MNVSSETKYLDKSKGIENIDEITKIINDQDLGLTSPSAVKALASKQNNEVSKQQLFHIIGDSTHLVNLE